MAKYGIGQPVSRFEDPRLLRGQGRYINDVNLPGQAHCAFLRSPHAHAKIVSVNTAAASASPGVIAIFTEADLAADGLGTMRVALPRKRPDGSPLFYVPHPGLARARIYADVPTAHEAGLPGYEVTSWHGMLAPAKVPRDIITRLNREIVAILEKPEVREALLSEGGDITPDTPEQFAALIKAESPRWGKVVRDANLKPQ